MVMRSSMTQITSAYGPLEHGTTIQKLLPVGLRRKRSIGDSRSMDTAATLDHNGNLTIKTVEDTRSVQWAKRKGDD